MGRLIYLDNLRSILSVLVVGHHSFLAASGLGRWYCSSAERHDEQIAMAFVATILFTSQAFLTGLLFGVAGLLMPRSLAKKGPSGHMVSRLWRLGLPVLLVGLPTHHLSQWLGHKLSKANVKLSESESASFQLSSGPGVAWFELWLLTFESIFVVLRGSQPIKIVPQNFSFLKVFCILLAIAIVQYSVEMHLAKPLAEFLPGWKGLAHHIIHTPLYGFCFLCGSLSDSTALLTMLRVHTKPLSITIWLGHRPLLPFCPGEAAIPARESCQPVSGRHWFYHDSSDMRGCVQWSSAALQHPPFSRVNPEWCLMPELCSQYVAPSGCSPAYPTGGWTTPGIACSMHFAMVGFKSGQLCSGCFAAEFSIRAEALIKMLESWRDWDRFRST